MSCHIYIKSPGSKNEKKQIISVFWARFILLNTTKPNDTHFLAKNNLILICGWIKLDCIPTQHVSFPHSPSRLVSGLGYCEQCSSEHGWLSISVVGSVNGYLPGVPQLGRMVVPGLALWGSANLPTMSGGTNYASTGCVWGFPPPHPYQQFFSFHFIPFIDWAVLLFQDLIRFYFF